MADYADIVKRLRDGDFMQREGFGIAADAIEALSAENKKLREALGPVASTRISNEASDFDTIEVFVAHIRKAREVLGEE
jgi:hypothetical protein